MTHSRRGFERCFDLAERIVLPEHNRTASVADAEVYFARHAMQELGIADIRTWRTSFMNAIERKVSLQEAADRLEALLAAGEITQIKLDPSSETTNGKTIRKQDPIRYMLSSDVPLLEEVQAGCVPAEWKPIGPATNEETSFLAPLDIVSARGRALPVFGFNYKWEVYTPVIQRRWGYYVLPVLFCDQLIARFDSTLDRKNRTLNILGFWLEEGMDFSEQFDVALCQGFERFSRFIGAERVELGILEERGFNKR